MRKIKLIRLKLKFMDLAAFELAVASPIVKAHPEASVNHPGMMIEFPEWEEIKAETMKGYCRGILCIRNIEPRKYEFQVFSREVDRVF